ncbi:hypothetical protein KEF85_05935 [Methylomonas paludis]|uniref:Uncharacterized protein n=1 Tax=Methylomonas paludis TaxID=1173101 RepID=A0A975MR66_9GAMM|nr:hypothetical protein [Methylomonas paludis]QWF71994.1 hypothetical protein KEF85_05935 [Methylomonas paludis]
MTISREELRDTLTEFFDEQARLDAVTHSQHHAWIALKIDAEKQRIAMYRAIAKAALSWSVPVLLGAVWYFVQHGKWPGG